ncbi:MAG: hypothetical protein QCH35_08025 [Methanomicrobiaceae archaeon]|nr:hypothetical protein [Methanomicrobiaceae archaeon]
MKWILCAILLLVLAAGCTAPSPDGAVEPTAMETATPTAEPAPPVTEKILILDPALEGLAVTFEAVEGGRSAGTIIVTYTLDNAKGWVGAPGERLDIMLTAFAYNVDRVPADFNPGSYQEVIRAGIPYQSSRIALYRTVYPGRIEVGAPSGIDPLDINRPYNYGLVVRPEP